MSSGRPCCVGADLTPASVGVQAPPTALSETTLDTLVPPPPWAPAELVRFKVCVSFPVVRNSDFENEIVDYVMPAYYKSEFSGDIFAWFSMNLSAYRLPLSPDPCGTMKIRIAAVHEKVTKDKENHVNIFRNLTKSDIQLDINRVARLAAADAVPGLTEQREEDTVVTWTQDGRLRVTVGPAHFVFGVIEDGVRYMERAMWRLYQHNIYGFAGTEGRDIRYKAKLTRTAGKEVYDVHNHHALPQFSYGDNYLDPDVGFLIVPSSDAEYVNLGITEVLQFEVEAESPAGVGVVAHDIMIRREVMTRGDVVSRDTTILHARGGSQFQFTSKKPDEARLVAITTPVIKMSEIWRAMVLGKKAPETMY